MNLFADTGLPEAKAKPLIQEANRLLQRISEVVFAAYMDTSSGKNSSQSQDDNGHAVVLAQVDDASAFVNAAIDLIQHAQKAMNNAEIEVGQKQIAGKPAKLIQFPQQKKAQNSDDSDSPFGVGSFLLVQMDLRTVLACAAIKPDELEQVVRKLAKAPADPLSKNQSLQKTTALLPRKLQVAVYLPLDAFGELLGLPKLSNGTRKVPPVALAVHAISNAVEAEFLIPFGTLKAVSEAEKASHPKK
jgi:hypothetical protein